MTDITGATFSFAPDRNTPAKQFAAIDRRGIVTISDPDTARFAASHCRATVALWARLVEEGHDLSFDHSVVEMILLGRIVSLEAANRALEEMLKLPPQDEPV